MRAARHIPRLFIPAALIALIAVTPLRAIESFGVGVVPANPQANNPRTQSIFVHQLPPGAQVKDAMRVANNSSEQKTISITAVDSELSSDGAFACKQAVDKKESVGSWIQLEKTEITLQPNTNETVPFTISTPQNASVGEHNGCIAVQDTKKNEASTNGIVLSFRSALRVVVMVPGDIHAELTAKDLKTSLDRQKVTVSPVLHNSGNVSLDTEIKVDVRNIFGLGVASGGGKFPILRDVTSQFNIELEQPFWGGFYWVSGEAIPEVLQTTSEKGERSHPVALPGKWIFVAPQTLALAMETLAVLLISGAIGFTVWRRHKMTQHHFHALHHTVRPGDDIESLAKHYNVRWQLIAKLNNLKPPYKLAPGHHIKIPKK